MKKSGYVLFLLLLVTLIWSNSDQMNFVTPGKTANTDKNPRMIVPDASYERPLNLTEVFMHAIKNKLPKTPLPQPRQLPKGLEKFYGPLPVSLQSIVESEESSHRSKYFRAADPLAPSEALDYGGFDLSDHLVSIPSANGQFQPTIATDDSGIVYAAWVENLPSGAWAIMASRSTDGGITWSTSITVDGSGINMLPRLAAFTLGAYTRVHLSYQKVEMHTYDIYDTSGTFLGVDTTYEGDVYYSRSNNSGVSYSSHYPIANSDIDLIIIYFNYDESYPDVCVDDGNNVVIAYNSQADEGHIISIAILIIYIILFEGLPPFWFDYTWYTVCYRASTNGGGTFNDEEEIVNDWFVDRWYPAIDVDGVGSGAKLFVSYAQSGFLSLMEATTVLKAVTNPFYSPSVGSEIFVGDGYCIGGGLKVGNDGNPRVGFTDDWAWDDYDVWYTHSLDGGASFEDPIDIDYTTSDCYEPRIGLDDADNPFLAWTDMRAGGDYDIYCVWSEDAGMTMRMDQHRVNHDPWNDNQYWPGVSLFLCDSIRRLDIDWWDTRLDPDGDIYFNSATWWRTNIIVRIHDTLANPMGGTVDLTYWSFGEFIEREIDEGTWIVYHDPYTEITVGGISSGSNSSERWILNETGHDTLFTPASPGQTWDLVYYDQYYTTFTVTKGNSAACPHDPPTNIPFTYEYFAGIEFGLTDLIHWANVIGEYSYTETFVVTVDEERWHTPEPVGTVTSPLVSPTYYHQHNTTFLHPDKLNNETGECACTHPVPAFDLVQRYQDGTNINGTTELTDWTDCGSIYEYENPRVITSQQRWWITEGLSDVVLGLGPYQAGVYHQWMPSIVLVGPADDNTTCAESYFFGGLEYYETDLWGTYQPWIDCASRLKMCDFTTLGWVARDPTEFLCVTSAFMAMIHYGNVVAVTLRNDFGYGFIVADGGTLSSPAVLGWAPSTEHVITAVTPQEFGTVAYSWDHWDDAGAVSHMVTVISDTEFVAYFNKQYFLEVISDHDSPWGEGWYDEGTDADFGVDAHDSVGGLRYTFTGWTGTGTGSYTGSDTSETVTMNNPITEESHWDIEYKLSLNYTACEIAPTLVGADWYNAAAMAPISTDSILGDDGTETDSVRCLFDHWESTPGGAVIGCPNCANTLVFMDQPYTLTAVYQRQYRLWVYNPDGDLGEPEPDTGAHWVSEGDTVIASVISPYMLQYCTGYEGTGSLLDGYSDTAIFVLEEPSSITWHWGEQLLLEIHAMIDGLTGYQDGILVFLGASPAAGVTPVTPGTEVTIELASTIYNFAAGWRDSCYGWHAVGGPCMPLDECEGTGSSYTFTMNQNTLWIWDFKQQCTFDVKCTTYTGGGCIYDDPEPPYGTEWVDYGSEMHATIDPYVPIPAPGWYCVGYYSNFGPGFGTLFHRTINGPSWLAWRWVSSEDIESLVVISDHGQWGCIPPAGVIYVERGTFIDPLAAPMYDEPETLDGTRFQCTGWTGTGCIPSSGATNYVPGGVIVNESGTITWEWQTQHRLNIFSDYDTPYPDTGSHWWPEGAAVTCSVSQVVDTTDTGTSVYCTGWHADFPQDTCLDLGVLDTLANTPFTFTLNCPVDITWQWSDYLAPLYVYSDHDNPIPSDTSYWIPGTEITAFVTSPADWDTAYGERWLINGWTGTGDVPPSGTGSVVSFTINDTSSLTWDWQQQFRIHVTATCYPDDWGIPLPTYGDHWFNVGDSSRFAVHPIHVEGSDTFYCTGFFGTGCLPAEWPMAEIWLDVTAPGTLSWQWHHQDSVVPLYVISEYDNPFPYGVSYWLIGDTVDATVDDSVVIAPDVIYCVGWDGTGDSLPEYGDSTHIEFRIIEACTLEWDWSTICRFTVLNPDGWDTPHPPVGEYIHATGSYISGYVEDPFFIDAFGDTHYCVGYLGTGDLPAESPQWDFEFTINENSSIEWRWSDDAYQLDVYSDYGSPHPYGTTYWIPGSIVSASVDANVDLGAGIRAHCTGYVGTGSCPGSGSSNSVAFSINENSSVTWLWELQYEFTVSCSTIEGGSCGYDAPIPSYGSHWYNEDELVAGIVTTNPVYDGDPDSVYCIGYVGTGDIADTSHQTDFSFNITQPSSITWIWAPGDTVEQLTVISSHDNPMPYGVTYWLRFQHVDATVDSIAYSPDSTERHNCLGFEITGTIDSLDSFSSTYIGFDIDQTTDLTWLWDDQFYVTLEYDGLPGACSPIQIGEGWYAAGETAWVETETPVDCGPFGNWGFYVWRYSPYSPGVVADTLLNSTYLVVDDNYTLTAYYSLAHQVMVKKDPSSNNTGWIFIDTEYHESTSIVVDWWGEGSYHDIGVPSLDSTLFGRRYIWDYWGHGGDTLHRVGPISNDTTFTAYYTPQILIVVMKNPPHNTGWIEVDSIFYWDSSYVYGELVTIDDTIIICTDSATTGCSRSKTFWWSPGLRHTFEASPADSFTASLDSAQFFFDFWRYTYGNTETTMVSDTSWETWFVTDTIVGPGSFVANYISKWRIALQKEPPETCGYFLFITPSDTDTVWYVSEHSFWSLGDEMVTIGVSEYDIKDMPGVADDSLYRFNHWSDAGAAVHEIGPITSAIYDTAFYDDTIAVLGIIFEPGDPYQYNWHLGTLDPGETHTMSIPESLKVRNDGNVPCDLGIMVYSGDGWYASYFQAADNFVLMAEFTNINSPPTTFDRFEDYVKMSLDWAEENKFGPGGFNLLPDPPYENQMDYLWLEFLAPTSTSILTEVRIVVLVVAKYRMP